VIASLLTFKPFDYNPRKRIVNRRCKSTTK